MPINYTYNAERKGAHYLIEGEEKYKNGGEFAECVCKAIRGFKAEKDANTKFDKGSDIEETKTSIKSNGCGLTDEKLADNKEDFLAEYFRRTHSTNVDYVIIIDEEVVGHESLVFIESPHTDGVIFHHVAADVYIR